MKRILNVLTALVLTFAMVLPLLMGTSAATGESRIATLTGETSRQSREILLDDGTPTGVLWTKITLGGKYALSDGSEKVLNVAEFSLSNTHLSVEVINSGSTVVSSATTAKASADYTASHKGQTVLAAINGDLWMTGVHSNSDVTTKVLKVTRGALILDGEIWASQQIDMENYAATNAEKGSPAGDKAAFGVTADNQPLVGSPDIRVSVTVDGKEIATDGLNRLPCLNSIIVYNRRINSSNYALNDAYEVEIEVDGEAAFTAGGTLTGKVKAIYPANSATRPGLTSANTVVLTARGNKVNTLKDNFSVGDTVSLSCTLTDRWGNTDLWQNVQEAIGGHMQVLVDGKQGVANSSSSEYPTTFIGYRDDGSVMLCNVTSAKEETYAGLKFSHAYKLCTEMGYNSVFYLDGGGSSTFVTLEDGSYTVRNNCSDKGGSARSVVNSVGVVWNDTPVCQRQGSLSYIDVPVDLSAIPPTYMDGALLAEVVGGPNAVNLSYNENEKALAITTSVKTNDPYATLSFDALAPADAEAFPYLVFKVKTDHKSKTKFKLYYAAGSVTGPTETCTRVFQVPTGDEWQYIVVDMSKATKWSGALHNIRLDIFDSAYTEAGTTMYIGAIVLCDTLENAKEVENGWVPEGAISDFLAYKESLKPVETEPETEAPTEPVTEPETETETPTEPETEAPTEPETEAPTDTETPTTPAVTETAGVDPSTTEAPADDTDKPSDTGCQSAVMPIGLVALATLSVCVLKKSRKHD